MLRPRFESVSLGYGRHDDAWGFPDTGRPVVIAGPNGSGKTTLVEGLVRTLFGFDRRRGSDAACLEARRPWHRETMRGTIRLVRDGHRSEIQRDFRTGRVRVHAPDEGMDRFDGDGNPAGRNQEARQFRQILTDLLGLRDLDSYSRTLLIQQGDLPGTILGDHFLQVAAGGHAKVEAARREIAAAHRAVTRRPLHTGAAAAVNPRDLEKIEEEIAAIRSRLQAATEAGKRRGPLTLERERTAERLEVLDAEIELLEDARSALGRTEAVEIRSRTFRDAIRRADLAAASAERARDQVSAAESARRDALEGGRYPDDFPERLARAELRWRDIEARSAPPRWPLAVALVLLAAAVALLVGDLPAAAGAAAAAGVITLAAWALMRRADLRGAARLQRDLGRALEGVPDADTLDPETAPRRLARHRAQVDADLRVRRARDDLADELRAGRRLVRELKAVGLDSTPLRSGDHGRDGVSRLLDRLEGVKRAAGAVLTSGQAELERVGQASLDLPADVPPTEEAVADALADRRRERARVQASLQEIGQELLERGTPAESVDALEAALASREPRREALSRKAEVLEAAHALLTDAYDAFRDRDQERLVGLVSRHADALTDGRVGPVLAEDSLDDARVRVRQRAVPLATPPLSFGEFHALLLAIRLGAAEFLGGVGIVPPLIVDEPFAHLDRERSHAVWRLLRDVAEERQVIVTSADQLLLDDLGIEPDIRLAD